jgi:hypothetical protein
MHDINPDDARREAAAVDAVQAHPALAHVSTDDLLAVLLARPDLDDITRRLRLVGEWEYTGDAEDFAALDPADQAGLWVVPVRRPAAPATDPEVIRYAALVLDAIHADMARDLIPVDVGGFGPVHDYRDANVYLIKLVPFDARGGCTCTPDLPAESEYPGDHPYLHAETCGIRADGGALDQHVALTNAVTAEVDRLLMAEAAADPRRPATVAEEVTGIQGAMTGAAERYELPARFTAETTPAGNSMRITDRVTGLSAVVGLFAYGTARALLAALFPGDDGNAVPLPPAIVRCLTDALRAALANLPAGAAIAGDAGGLYDHIVILAQAAPGGMLQITARPAGAL